jgi:DNA primase
MQDFFRARVMFPIFDENGNAVAFGGRILPGVADQAKYKNSTETPVYTKSRVLYGLNWSKGDAVRADRLVVCEGYTDVIGFHRSGVTTAVATCGTALTEDHVRLMKKYARNVVLAFDADSAGQGAAEKFYAWEKKYDVTVSVAQFPEGKDPGDLANSDPASLVTAVEEAMPFLGFRLRRLYAANPGRTPEARARTAELAMDLVNEHPDPNVRRLYANEVAVQTGVPANELMRIADRGKGRPAEVLRPVRQAAEGAGFMALALLIHDWDAIAPWLIEELFVEEPYRDAFRALAETEGDVHRALALVEGEAADLIERAAVHDVAADAAVEARTLIGAAARRMLGGRVHVTDPEELRTDQAARVALADLARPERAANAAVMLLQWLAERAGASA